MSDRELTSAPDPGQRGLGASLAGRGLRDLARPVASTSNRDDLPANTIVVAKDGTGHATSVHAALPLAAEGWTILVRAGDYDEPLLAPTVDITIRGEGRESTTLRSMDGALLALRGGLTVTASNLTVTGDGNVGALDPEPDADAGDLEPSEPILLSVDGATLILRNVLAGHHSGSIASVAGTGGSLACHDSTIEESGGAAIFVDGADCSLTSTAVVGARVGLYSRYGNVWSSFATFKDHTVAGVWLEGGSTHLNGCIFSKNANGVVTTADSFPNEFERCQFYSNTRGLTVRGSDPVVVDCEFYSNSEGLKVEGEGVDPVVSRCRFEDGQSAITIVDASGTYRDCSAKTQADTALSVWGQEARPTIFGLRVRNAGGFGARVNWGEVVLDGCDIRGTALAGIYLESDVNATIRGCHISGSDQGGGVWITDAVAQITGTTIADCAKSALEVSGADARVSISGSTVHRCLVGVWAHDQALVLASDNQIDDVENEGILVTGVGTKAWARGNLITEAGMESISLKSGAWANADTNVVDGFLDTDIKSDADSTLVTWANESLA